MNPRRTRMIEQINHALMWMIAATIFLIFSILILRVLRYLYWTMEDLERFCDSPDSIYMGPYVRRIR